MAPEAAPTDSSPALTVRYRDRWILVVDKPFGMPSQPDQGGHANVYDLVVARERYAALHHRLDTPASGLLVLSLSPQVNAALARGFREHRIQRLYLGVVVGDPGPSGVWDAPLDGQRARTRWERCGVGEGMSVLRFDLETGRMHQIRRHAAAAGAPLVGDRRYGGAAGRAWPRLALHAARLVLPHPVTGSRLCIDAPMPEDLRALVARAGWTDP